VCDEAVASVISCSYAEEIDLAEKILFLALEIFSGSHRELNVILTHALVTNQPGYFGKDS
jgi:hypothetical protein